MRGFEVLGNGSIGRVALAKNADAYMKEISVEEGGEKEEKKATWYHLDSEQTSNFHSESTQNLRVELISNFCSESDRF